MQKFCNPKWLLLVNTLPLLILFAFFIDKYQMVHSLLSPENIRLWKYLGSGLAVLAIANLAYAVYLIIKRQTVHTVYAIIALAGYITFLYIYGYHLDRVMPFTIPRWMLPVDLELYVGTFIMPTLIHALFILVVRTTSSTSMKGVWKDFSVILVVPVTWYVFTQVILPFWKLVVSGFRMHVIVIISITAVLIFLFFLIRGVYILGVNKSERVRKFQLLWKVPFTILFPLAGLALNNGLFNTPFSMDNGVFGDFSNHWYYILALVNGVLLCLPRLEHRAYRLALFAARGVTFSYTCYFFLVFLPFLPLSVISVTAIGAGFLMLTPLVLFVIHVNELVADTSYLGSAYAKTRLYLMLAVGMLVIPAAVTFQYLHDRTVLNTALDYLYNPDYAQHYAIDRRSLAQTMRRIEGDKVNERAFVINNHTPYLSAYFNWLVLDNLTLSRSKIATINRVFFGKSPNPAHRNPVQKGEVAITRLTGKSRFDEKQHVWISQVELELTNKTPTNRSVEYATTVDLPAGCWISDYYLYVGDKKTPGLLAEKKSAMWIYAEIVNARRDPGILYYLTGNKVALRVFPFAKDEVRKTGIEFIHKEPFKLKIGKQAIKLGEPGRMAGAQDGTQLDSVTYISARHKASLDKVYRKPYFHFIVDVSSGQDTHYADYLQRIKTFLAKQPKHAAPYKLSLVNTYTTTYTLPGPGQDAIRRPRFAGGFYLDRAIKTILVDSYNQHANTYPVMVVISDAMDKAIIENNFAALRFAYPERAVFYNLNGDAKLFAHSLLANPLKMKPASIAQTLQRRAVLAYPSAHSPQAYLPLNDKPDIVLRKNVFTIDDPQLMNKNWQSALRMQGVWRSQLLNPHIAGDTWPDLVRGSIKTGIMTPLTSYLVVENDAQRQVLLRKQQQILAGNKGLDPGEDVMTMSEPGMQIMLLLLSLLLLVKLRFGTKRDSSA